MYDIIHDFCLIKMQNNVHNVSVYMHVFYVFVKKHKNNKLK